MPLQQWDPVMLTCRIALFGQHGAELPFAGAFIAPLTPDLDNLPGLTHD